MMKNSFFYLIGCILFFCSCEEKVPMRFEGDPQPNIRNGSEITETTIKLEIHGVCCNYGNTAFKFYIGTDPNNLDLVESEEIKLIPYNQYFWYAVPYETEHNKKGAPTEVYSFYCVPPVEVVAENGDGDWSTTLNWGEVGKHMEPMTIDVTPNIEGYAYEDDVKIEPGQTSYTFKLGDGSDPTNAAYTHWWDDANAVYYEPIVYTYKFNIRVKVGDRSYEYPQEIKEVIINKQDCVRDHEFNVYRLGKIGNKIWTIDDYRAKTYYDYYYDKYVEAENSFGIGLIIAPQTCAAYYNTKAYKFSAVSSDNVNKSIPKGFHISTEQDWLDLEAYYGVVSDLKYGNENEHWVTSTYDFEDTRSRYGLFRSYLYTGNDQYIKANLSSPYGWETEAVNDSVEQSIGIGAIFNAKPTEYGTYYNYGYKTTYVVYYVPDGWNRALSSESNGIARKYAPKEYDLSIRLVKD